MKVKVAAIQAESVFGEEEWQNVDRAIRYMDEVSGLGAHLVCFPEGYPGPAHGPLDSKGKLSAHPIDLLREKIREVGVYCACSDVVEHEDLPEVYYLCQKLIGPDGEILADHRRCQPDEPELNEYLFGGKRLFAPGDGPTVVETEIGVIGLLICSELWVPELPRIAMLQGAEIIISPVNGLHTTSLHSSDDPPLWETWRCISRCRAAENVQYVIVTQNAFDPKYAGVGHIAGPESLLAEYKGVGVFTAELDMDRLRYLRGTLYEYEMLDATNLEGEHTVLGTRPGQNRLRYPALYSKLVEPSARDFDYDFYVKELALGRKLKTVAGGQED
ncbi:MAG: carbon-nitrogen hydrolase family protein [bacterium]